jgi:REP element-mobilizing transposase RayT
MTTFFHRHLPHFHVAHATYFITFRLAGSLPVEAVMRIQEEYQAQLRSLEQTLSGSALHAEQYRAQKQHFARLDALLDQACHGPRWLAQAECAQIVADCIHELAPAHYHLHGFSIMFNHVHLMIDQQGIPEPPQRADGRTYTALSQAMRLLKGKSAALCNRVLGRRAPFWQHESYDHLVRDDGEYARILAYIANNPVKAGLVKDWEDWRYTYIAWGNCSQLPYIA